jgi:anti-sigma regulatory factor (Ser/Thr protein kinase)
MITVPAAPKYLCLIRDVTARLGAFGGLEKPLVDTLKLAVDEACANIIKHTYKGDTGKKIRIRYRITEKAFETVIEDSGEKVAPELLRGRDLEDVRPGGLGIHFIKRAFDVVSYDGNKKRGNRLRLIKYLGEE